MSDPHEPRYPQDPSPYPAYPPPGSAGYPPPGYPPPRRPQLAERIGERLVRRPEPRLGIALAGVGIGLTVVGVVVWAGDFLAGGGGGGGRGGGSRRLLGIALSLAVIAVGYALAASHRRGPLATAGVAASALGVPVLLGFLSFDASGGGLPFSLDAIALVSVAVWILSYLLVAGARGHAFYLGLSAVTLWIYLVDKAAPDAFSLTRYVSQFTPFDNQFGRAPDWAAVAAVSLTFGLAYYVAAYLLDRSGRCGAAVAFVVAGFAATAAGIGAAANELHQIGTGIVLIVLGLVLGGYGARAGRRFTTWAWSVAVGLGVVVILTKIIPNNSAAAGIALIVVGAAVVFAGHLWSVALREPDDLTPQAAVTAAGPPNPSH
ncbi:MAG: hypothetical protein JWO57_2569 [Pseudonocardiales bacterium]|nr:hypothetical protein [Pseudonocardiales bacterium]